MTQDEIRAMVLQILYDIAPELKDQSIEEQVNFRDQFDFNSLDFLNFTTALQQKLQADIPVMDYPRLSSLAGCVKYFST
ncbi:MAG: acyl carrier protein [Chromatiales bacterium]|jgi:acyl carrier protein